MGLLWPASSACPELQLEPRAAGWGSDPPDHPSCGLGVFSPQVTVCWVDEAGASSTHCLSPQAEHAGVRTYFFSAESPEEQEAWIQAMGEAARVQIPPAQKSVPPQASRHK